MRLGLSQWVAIISLQILYGVVVFVVTRDIYQREPASATLRMDGGGSVSIPGSERVTVADAQRLIGNTRASASLGAADSLEQLSGIADERFRQGRFDEAAEYYVRILERAPDKVDVYNNLGLTLHYVGRTREAIEKLEQGIAIDDGHQRIWLTLGFVQAGAGDVTAARRALTRAVELDPDSQIGHESKRIMDSLP